jgi:adenosylcobinamide kinase/adenosylcobinamide-phosphate guanylyltransferase
MGKLTFILGGARSGKSDYARRLAEKRGGRVTFIATATASDDEMAARIAAHRRERPAGWVTREIPSSVAAALEAESIQTDTVLLDCLTLLVGNLLLQDGGPNPDDEAAARIETEVDDLLTTVQESNANWIVVSNEVGAGLVPPYPSGRIYRDLLGRANQRFARRADEVFWMVAGIPVPIGQYR